VNQTPAPEGTGAADRAADADLSGRPEVPAPGVDPALPSVGARVLAFGSIILAGVCGGLIGYAFIDLQCTGDCGTVSALGGLVGAVVAAAGVAVVAVLALRAMGEWQTIKERPGGARPDYGDLRRPGGGTGSRRGSDR
jgi:hypothetical protein